MYLRTLWLLLLLATAACYSDRSVGVSTRRGTDEPAKPKFPSKIVGQAGEALSLDSPAAGDMDGDGYDDFLVLAMREWGEDGNYQYPLLYLFYGRPEFPSELSTADADAAFEVDSGYHSAAGDLNGDGFDDLLLTQSNAVNFVFGAEERIHGLFERSTAGVRWTLGELPPPFSIPGLLISLTVRSAGDLNGDGCSDLIVSAAALLSADTGEFGERRWIVPGFRGEWQSVAWDASNAIADFGYSVPPPWEAGMKTLLAPERAGDVDGDHRADLLAFSGTGSLVFYGKPTFPPEIQVSDADANLIPTAGLPAPDEFFGGASGLVAQQLGDLDADGKDDLAVLTRGDVFEVAYGKRWAGESALETDLQVVGPRPNDHVMLAAAGDLDSDGFPELLLNVAAPPNDNFLITDYETRVYVLRGTGKRLRGRIQLSENDRWTPPVTQPADTVGMFNLMLAGDIDGDGSQELLTSFVSIDPSHTSPVYLLPSTPRSPD